MAREHWKCPYSETVNQFKTASLNPLSLHAYLFQDCIWTRDRDRSKTKI